MASDAYELDSNLPQLLFTKSKFLDIDGTKVLSKHNNWQCFGLNYEVNPLITTSFTVKMLAPRTSDNEPHMVVGFASKNVIETNGHDHFAAFRDGFGMYINGYFNVQQRYGAWLDRPIALRNELTVEINNWVINIYDENEKIKTLDDPNLLKSIRERGKTLYPAVSILGQGALAQIVRLQSYNTKTKKLNVHCV